MAIKSSKNVRLWALTLLMGALLGGCSSDSKKPPSETPTHVTPASPPPPAIPTPPTKSYFSPFEGRAQGLRFECDSSALIEVEKEMEFTFKETGMSVDWVKVRGVPADKVLEYTLKLEGVSSLTDTLHLHQMNEFDLKNESVDFERWDGSTETAELASHKEILLALMRTGRVHYFRGQDCSVLELKRHIGLRQHITFSGWKADWTFPEKRPVVRGNGTKWGFDWVLHPRVTAYEAAADAFTGEHPYALGCTNAVRLILLHGILDYFGFVQKELELFQKMHLYLGKRPLQKMGEAEIGDDVVSGSGVLLRRHLDVAWNNWVPGDWGWIKNTDEKSSEVEGSEGANIVYGGSNRFIVYYDRKPPRTLDESLTRVYEWRDWKLRAPSSVKLTNQLRRDPSEGGLLRDVRDFPLLTHEY